MEVSESHERCMIHKHVCTEWVKWTTAILEAHERPARCTYDQKHPIFVRLVSGTQVSCTSHLLHKNDTRPNTTKHYVLYGMATANKFAKPERAKTRTAGYKTSLIRYQFWCTRCSCWLIKSLYLILTKKADWQIHYMTNDDFNFAIVNFPFLYSTIPL
jgi:hypothetical protein